jgi:hypothetical protein
LDSVSWDNGGEVPVASAFSRLGDGDDDGDGSLLKPPSGECSRASCFFASGRSLSCETNSIEFWVSIALFRISVRSSSSAVMALLERSDEVDNNTDEDDDVFVDDEVSF